METSAQPPPLQIIGSNYCNLSILFSYFIYLSCYVYVFAKNYINYVFKKMEIYAILKCITFMLTFYIYVLCFIIYVQKTLKYSSKKTAKKLCKKNHFSYVFLFYAKNPIFLSSFNFLNLF